MQDKPYPLGQIEDWLSRPDGFLLRLARVAAVLDRSPRQIRRMIEDRVLQGVGSGPDKNLYVAVGEVRRYIEAHKKGRKTQ